MHHVGGRGGGGKKSPTFWLLLKATQKAPVIKDKWKITAYYMVLHSLQQLQVLITNCTSHLSYHQRGRPEHGHRRETKHAQFAKPPYG